MRRSKDTAANTLPNLIFGIDKGGPLGAEAAKRVQTHLGSANLPIRRQWTPEEREQLLTLERPPSAPTAE